MTEIEAPREEEVAAPVAPESFGRQLAAERERQGLSIDDVAARLRLHPRQVRAIEEEALNALPAPFLRGFVRNYAKELRLDPAPLLAELSTRLGPKPGAAQAVEGGSASVSRLSSGGGTASRRLVVGGVVAALITLAVLGGLATRSDRRDAEPPPPAAKPAEPIPAPPASVAPDAPKMDLEQQPAGETAAAAPVPQAEVPSVAAVSPPAVPFYGLRMSFREQSWVEITQADGRIVHSQINAAGSEQRIEGKAPLRVVIGNAPAVSIEYKGKSVDLKPATAPDNVARITLN